jgi:hypothetical protein
MAEMDDDQSGAIDFEEFFAWYSARSGGGGGLFDSSLAKAEDAKLERVPNGLPQAGGVKGCF